MLYYTHHRPYKKHDTDAGWDLCCTEYFRIKPGSVKIVATGVSANIPKGFVGLVKDRSSMAASGFMVGGGVIDSGYSGEIKVILYNMNEHEVPFKEGERIAQLLVVPCEMAMELRQGVAPQLDERGDKGFGSTNDS